MKKIAFIHFAYPPTIGGVEILMQEQAHILSELGYQITILTGSGTSDNKSVTLIEVPEFQSLKNIDSALQDEINSEKISDKYNALVEKIQSICEQYLNDKDTVIIHNMLTLKRNLPFIEGFKKYHEKHSKQKVLAYTHDHAYILEEKLGIPDTSTELERRLLTTPLKDMHYITISDTFGRLLAKLMHLPPERVHTIPNGININKFLEIDPIIATFINEYKILEKFPIIMSPVNIVERKNLEYSVKIIAELKKSFPDIVYIITGQTSKHKDTSDYFNKIQSLIESLGLKDNALYFSYIYNRYLKEKEMHDLYTIADAVFYFSKSENFGLPLLEAGLSKTPIFSSNLDVFKEVRGQSEFAVDVNLETPENVGQKVHAFFSTDPVSKLNYRTRTTYELKNILQKYLLPLL